MDKDELRRMIQAVIREELSRRTAAPEKGTESLCAVSAATPVEHRFEGKVLTAVDLATVSPHATVVISAGTLVSPLVRELVTEKNIRLLQAEDRQLPGIALGGVRAAVARREELAAWLERSEYPVFDFGANTQDREPSSHYLLKVARAVSENHYPLGVFLDDAGVGAVILANKFPGVRAVYCSDLETARTSRRRYAANLLVLRADQPAVAPAEILRLWLATACDDADSRRELSCVREVEARYRSSG